MIAVVMLSGCGGRDSHRFPLITLSPVEAGGAGVRGVIGDTQVDYTPGRYFGVGFLVKNRSDRPVTITRVSSTDSGRRFVRLVGVKLVPFAPPPCPASCPAPTMGLSPPFRGLPSLTALTVQPHHRAGVVLHFRWVGCLDAPRRTVENDNRALRVEYQIDGRRAEAQVIRTGGARLSVQTQTGVCPGIAGNFPLSS